jgi:hypothetical protein
MHLGSQDLIEIGIGHKRGGEGSTVQRNGEREREREDRGGRCSPEKREEHSRGRSPEDRRSTVATREGRTPAMGWKLPERRDMNFEQRRKSLASGASRGKVF